METMYYLKYFYSFKDIDQHLYKVEILEKDDNTIVPEEITGCDHPCIIKYPTRDLYSPICASGAELTLLSETDRQFIGLYTDDMTKFQVKIYQVIDDVNQLIWCGYLNSEYYREPFAEFSNYPVTLLANDGFNLLRRLQFGSYNEVDKKLYHYQGLSLMWHVIRLILWKLNLPWKQIKIGLSVTPTEYFLEPEETLFHKHYIRMDNWYNEDGDPESCRTVLEELLKPWGAIMLQSGGDLYITDSNYIASGGGDFKVFDYSFDDIVYNSTESINLIKGDITTLGVQSDRQELEVESGFNRQVIRFSAYERSKVLFYDAEQDTFSGYLNTVPGYPVWDEYAFNELTYTGSKFWTASNNGRFAKIIGTGTNNQGKDSQKMKIIPYQGWNPTGDYTGRLSFKWTEDLPIIQQSDKHFLKLDMSVFLMTMAKWGYTGAITLKIREVKLHMDIIHTFSVNGNTYKRKYLFSYGENDYNVTQGWTTDMTASSVIQIRNKEEQMNERDTAFYKWDVVDNGEIQELKANPFLIPLDGIGTGRIEIKIYDCAFRLMDDSYITGYGMTDTYQPRLYFNKIALTVTNDKGIEIKGLDYETVATLNEKFANSGPDLTNMCGCNQASHPLQQGAIMAHVNDNNFVNVIDFNKGGITRSLEDLLLRSVMANYQTANVRLTVDTPVIPSLGYLTYENFLPGKKLAIVGNDMDLSENISSLVLREVHQDSEATLNE